MTSKIISLPFTRCWWFTSSLEFSESLQETPRLNQNINITHHSPPHNENLRNQSKHCLAVKQRRMRSDHIPLRTSPSQKSKSLSWNGGLASFPYYEVVDESMHISKLFYFCQSGRESIGTRATQHSCQSGRESIGSTESGDRIWVDMGMESYWPGRIGNPYWYVYISRTCGHD